MDSPITDPARRRAILVAVCVALMAVVASASALSVAQQDLAQGLDASQSDVLWIINAYVVALAALLLPMGAVADRWGRRPVLVAGLVVFALATAAAGFADTVPLMVAVRAVAGVSAAMVMPVTLSVITSSFPAETRTQAIGVWSAVAGGGGLLGMIAAAVLVDVADWRWLFALPVALAVVALALALRSVPNSREHGGGRYDRAGALLSVAAVGGLVLGIHEGPEHGWTAPLALAGLVGGGAALAGFVVHELRCPAPLLDVRAFRDRRLASGSGTLLVLFAISAGVFVVLFPFFQAVLGWSALHAMLGLLPMIVVMMGASGAAARVAAAVGPRATVLAGVAVTAGGLALMAALVTVDGGYASVLPGLLLVGLGMGLTQPPATEAITSSLPADRQGVASALNDTTREVGSAVGIALLGAVLSAAYGDAMRAALPDVPADVAEAAGEGIGRAFDVAARQPDPAPIVDAARAAFVDGWAASIWVGAAATGLLLALLALSPAGPAARRGSRA
jgi:EmrB/QacA subfamily drug resistance transporter